MLHSGCSIVVTYSGMPFKHDFSFFSVGLARVRCDDSALPGHPLPAVALQQGQVRRAGEEQERLK